MAKNTPSHCAIIGITGSIAAYKTCDLVRELVRANWDVHVIMTHNATQFVTPMTFQTLARTPVTVGLFDQIREWMPGHISLADKADVLCIAPATGNVIAKIAHGIADDAVTTTALAFRGPCIIAPAMNSAMYTHPATQDNLATLAARGVQVLPTEEGEMACGTTGPGRLAPVSTIFSAITTAVAPS